MNNVVMLSTEKQNFIQDGTIDVVQDYTKLYKKLLSKSPPRYILIDVSQLNYVKQCKWEFPFLTIICLIPTHFKFDITDLLKRGVDYSLVYSDYHSLHSKLIQFLSLSEKQNFNITRNNTIALDYGFRTITYKSKVLYLAQKEFHLLEFLFINNKKLISKEKLLEAVWGYSSLSSTKTLEVHIGKLRNKLLNEYKIQFIKTIHGKGYCLEIPAK